MAANLTEGAITFMCRDDFSSEDFKPVLQVIDLKLVQAQQHSVTERYRLVLSDGSHYQQGMLATQKNELVHDGRLQKGSVVILTQFICNVVQNRKIIIIIDLDVVLEKCDLIGEPAPAPRTVHTQSSTGQSGAIAGNPQSMSNTLPTANVSGATGPSLDPPKMNHLSNNAYPSGSDLARYVGSNVASTFAKSEPGANLPKSTPLSGSYGDQNKGFCNPQSETSRPLQSRPPQEMFRQPSPVYPNRGPIARNEALPRIIPIAALNPYQNMWTIKIRVTAKGELRHYNNPRGEGKVFSFDLLDSEGGEIRATCFNAVADQFYNQVAVGKVYLISKGSIKPAQKNFNHLRNDQELTLDMTSFIQPCHDDDNSIPKQLFHFRPISEVESLENNSVIDVIGLVSSISPTASIMRKNGTETQKRVLQLKDTSCRSVELTLWGNFCNSEGQRLQSMCDSGAFPILAVKAARVNDFNGKTVGTIASSQLFIDPDSPEAYRLKEWFDREGRNIPTVSISREISNIGSTDIRKTVSQIKDEKLGTSEKPDWINVIASVSFIKVDNFCYTACPIMIGDRQCNKKVTNNGDGKWRCDRCDQTIDNCDFRYILQLQLQDHTGLTWVTTFQECGEEIMGVPAKDLYYLKYEEQDDEKFAEIIRRVLFNKYIFKLKVKEEIFSDEQRVKSTVVKADKVNFSSESRFLLDWIDKLKAYRTEDVNHNSIINNTGIRNVGSGQYAASREYATTANQGVQYGNQYNGYFPSSGGSGSYMSCNNCGCSGHSSANCPNNMSGPARSTGVPFANRASAGSSGVTAPDDCFKCHQPGHLARDCPGFNAATPAYGSTSGLPARSGVAQKQQLGGY